MTFLVKNAGDNDEEMCNENLRDDASHIIVKKLSTKPQKSTKKKCEALQKVDARSKKAITKKPKQSQRTKATKIAKAQNIRKSLKFRENSQSIAKHHDAKKVPPTKNIRECDGA